MATDTFEIECLECEKDFETTSLKVDGETFKCAHCGHEHCAAYDDEQEVWYATHLPVPRVKFKHYEDCVEPGKCKGCPGCEGVKL